MDVCAVGCAGKLFAGKVLSGLFLHPAHRLVRSCSRAECN